MGNKNKIILFLFSLFLTIPIISFAITVENINVDNLEELLSGEGVSISNVQISAREKKTNSTF